MNHENQIEIAKAIAKGKTSFIRKLGLNKKNVNLAICENGTLKVKPKSGKPFIENISSPTPLIYAILCEQVDIVLYLILRLHASFEVSIVHFILNNV